MMSKRFFLMLLLLAFGVRRSADGQTRWPFEMNVAAFQVHADFSLQQHQQDLVELAQLNHEVANLFGLDPPSKETHVYLFRKKSTYRKYLKRYFPGLSQRRAMFIQQSGVGMVFACRGKEMMTDLRHEGVHAVLHSSLPMVPLWLDEGLAEYFEVPAKDRRSNNPHLEAIRKQGPGQITSIRELEKIDDFSKMQSHHYRDAWAWIHFSLHGSELARQTLLSYLHDIQQQAPPGAFSARMESAIPNLERSLDRHFFADRATPWPPRKASRLPRPNLLRYTHEKTRRIRH